MKRRNYLIRWILLFCLVIPSDVHAGFFTQLLSLFSGKAMFGLVVTAMAAYTVYRTMDTNKRFNKIDGAIKDVRTDVARVQKAVEDRPTKAEVAAHFTCTHAKIAACAQTQKVDAQFHNVKTQLTQASGQLTTIDSRVADVHAQLADAQSQLKEGFATTAKETAALRQEVTTGLEKLGAHVSGVESLTKDELQKVQAALKDDTGKKLTALVQELDERLANKKDVQAISASVAAVQATVKEVSAEMATQQQLNKMMHSDLQKFQAVTLLTLHGLCPVQASMQKLNDLFTQGEGARVFEIIHEHIADKDTLKAELEKKLGIIHFAQSLTAGLEAQMKLMVQQQKQLVTKIDAGIAAVHAPASGVAAPRPAPVPHLPLSFSKPFTLGLGASQAPLYHAVRSAGIGTGGELPAGTGAASFLALLPHATLLPTSS